MSIIGHMQVIDIVNNWFDDSSQSMNGRAIALASLLCLSSHNSFLFGFYSETSRTLPNMLLQPKSPSLGSDNNALHLIYKFANMTSGPWGKIMPSLAFARKIRGELNNRLRALRSVIVSSSHSLYGKYSTDIGYRRL